MGYKVNRVIGVVIKSCNMCSSNIFTQSTSRLHAGVVNLLCILSCYILAHLFPSNLNISYGYCLPVQYCLRDASKAAGIWDTAPIIKKYLMQR